MHIPGTVPKQVASIDWQGYRGSETGMIVYYNTDPVSEIPIREVPEDYPTEIVAEPNYESATYGLYGCSRPKIRASFFKSKLRYLFFMTRYAGTNVEYMDQLMVTGYYHICQTANVQKLHIRYLSEYGCLNEETCYALRADEVRFAALQDAFAITNEVLQEWGVSSRITRQSRIVLNAEATAALIDYFKSKEDKTSEYIAETKRLSPDTGEEDEDEELEDASAEELAQMAAEAAAESADDGEREEEQGDAEEAGAEAHPATVQEVEPQQQTEAGDAREAVGEHLGKKAFDETVKLDRTHVLKESDDMNSDDETQNNADEEPVQKKLDETVDLGPAVDALKSEQTVSKAEAQSKRLDETVDLDPAIDALKTEQTASEDDELPQAAPETSQPQDNGEEAGEEVVMEVRPAGEAGGESEAKPQEGEQQGADSEKAEA
jgi:hypothetical protein